MLYGLEETKADSLHGTFEALRTRIEYRPETLAWNVYDGALHLQHDDRSHSVRFDALILASGATDRIMPLPGWTLPGTYSLGGAQIALKAQACVIGTRPVFLGTGPLLYLVAYQYAKAGVKIAALLDTSPFSRRIAALPALATRPSMLAKGLYYSLGLARRGVPVLTGVTPVAISGEGRVGAVEARDRRAVLRPFACDPAGTPSGLRPDTPPHALPR